MRKERKMFEDLNREYSDEETKQGIRLYDEALKLLDAEEDFDMITELLTKAVLSGNPDAAYVLADWYADDPFEEGYSKEVAKLLAKFAYENGVEEAKELL